MSPEGPIRHPRRVTQARPLTDAEKAAPDFMDETQWAPPPPTSFTHFLRRPIELIAIIYELARSNSR